MAETTSKRSRRPRRGRRAISQHAHARGIDVKPARGRDVRTQRKREHEGHEEQLGPTKPRRSRAKAPPTQSDYAKGGSRSTARQRRSKAKEIEKKRHGKGFSRAGA